MGHSDSPPNGYAIPLRDYLLHVDVHVRKGSAEGAVDGLEGFGPHKN
jgi:hypothetical protein